MTSHAPYRSPLQLLGELEIKDPEQINIEAIAQYCGATVIYEPLDSCAARIIGVSDHAIITVDSRGPRQRQRFSAAHELGHWMRDRGRIAFGCEKAAFSIGWTGDTSEHRANEFAADLLLPEEMFRPMAREREIVFATVEELAR